MVKPWEKGIATVRRIAWPRGLSIDQLGVERYDHGELSLVETAVAEAPARPAEPLPLPVGEPAVKVTGREVGEADAAALLVLETDPPALDQEELLEVLSIVVGEIKATSPGDCRREASRVIDVV
jgi:hypothetical protein